MYTYFYVDTHWEPNCNSTQKLRTKATGFEASSKKIDKFIKDDDIKAQRCFLSKTT